MKIEYELSTSEEILESTEATGPLTFEFGDGTLHPALESLLKGLKAGDTFEKEIDPSVTFGERDRNLRFSRARAKLPEALRAIDVGGSFEAMGPDGKQKVFRVIAADADSITVDGNHPLAGQVLEFTGRVLEV